MKASVSSWVRFGPASQGKKPHTPSLWPRSLLFLPMEIQLFGVGVGINSTLSLQNSPCPTVWGFL